MDEAVSIGAFALETDCDPLAGATNAPLKLHASDVFQSKDGNRLAVNFRLQRSDCSKLCSQVIYYNRRLVLRLHARRNRPAHCPQTYEQHRLYIDLHRYPIDTLVINTANHTLHTHHLKH